MSTIREHDRVVLTDDVPNESLAASEVGTVVHVYGTIERSKWSSSHSTAKTCAVVTLEPNQPRSVRKRELTHARQMA